MLVFFFRENWHLKWRTAIFLAPILGIWRSHTVLMHLSAYVPAISQANGIDSDLFINGNFCFLLQRRLNMSTKTWKGPYVANFWKNHLGEIQMRRPMPLSGPTLTVVIFIICHLFLRLIVFCFYEPTLICWLLLVLLSGLFGLITRHGLLVDLFCSAHRNRV